MTKLTFFCSPDSEATVYAGYFLRNAGIEVIDSPSGITHYLAPIPTRSTPKIPNDAILIGGNLNQPGIDLLKDPFYLAENAAITARCAMRLLGQELREVPVLILGWGRIGKCLANFLENAGARVTVAARKPADVAMIQALGQEGIFINQAAGQLQRFSAVINTVPAPVLDVPSQATNCKLLELASTPGITGGHVIDGRGLPGKFAPEESGRLIARTILRILEVLPV